MEAQRKFIFIKNISNKNVFQLLFFITTREKALSTISWMFSGEKSELPNPETALGVPYHSVWCVFYRKQMQQWDRNAGVEAIFRNADKTWFRAKVARHSKGNSLMKGIYEIQ